MVAACTSVLAGTCNVDGDVKGDELLLIVVGVMVEMLLAVLDKLVATHFVGTGTKQIKFSYTNLEYK